MPISPGPTWWHHALQLTSGAGMLGVQAYAAKNQLQCAASRVRRREHLARTQLTPADVKKIQAVFGERCFLTGEAHAPLTLIKCEHGTGWQAWVPCVRALARHYAYRLPECLYGEWKTRVGQSGTGCSAGRALPPAGAAGEDEKAAAARGGQAPAAC